MPLEQWATNANLDGDYPPKGKQDYLGLCWDTASDTLSLKLPPEFLTAYAGVDHLNTKRKVVSLFSKVYDPTGLLSPITLSGKLFIQKLWLTQAGWDSKLTKEQLKELQDILHGYKGLETIELPRNAHQGSSFRLHVFCDASKKGFGVAAYVVADQQRSHLLTGHARVTPKYVVKLQ